MSFKRWLEELIPWTGRAIAEDGSAVNVADIARRQDANNIWPFGETLTGYKRDDIQLKYQYPFLNTEFDFRSPVTTGDGQVVQLDSLLQLTSTTGSASVESIDATSYRSGHSGFIDFTAGFSGSGTAIIGGKNAFQLRYDNGVLTFGYVKGASFESVVVPLDGINVENPNIWRIVYGYLGVASPVLLIKQSVYRQAAIVETEGNIPGTHVDDPNFTAYMAVSGDCKMISGSMGAGVIEGAESSKFRPFTFPNATLVDGPGPSQGDVILSGTTVATLAVFRSKNTYKTKDNTVKSFLTLWENYVQSPAAGTGDVEFQFVRNPTLSGVPTYSDIDTDNSVFEYDHTAGTGASVSYTGGGRVILQKQIPYSSTQGNRPGVAAFSTTQADQIGAVASAGDVFAIIAKDKNGNGVTVRSSLGWRERF